MLTCDAPPSTVTDSETEPTASLKFCSRWSWTFTVKPVAFTTLKPVASTSIRYRPGRTLGKVYRPELFVVLAMFVPRSMSISFTWAPTMFAPDGSRIWPETVPVSS